MASLEEEGSKLHPDTYLELFDFDASVIENDQGVAGTTSYYTNTPTGGLSPLLWQGNQYYPIPFELTGVENKGDGTAPPRPTLTVDNTSKFLLAAVQTMGNIIGMRITRWRTYYRFTDNGTDPDINQHYPVHLWIVTRKLNHTKNILQFEMSVPLDRPGLRLPAKLVLTDKGFPGVSRVRLR